MSLYQTIRVLYYNSRVILLACLLPTVLIFLFTRNMERKYEASAMLYTGIASGYTIESSGDQRIDYHGINNAFDNLISLMKSRETLEEVGLELLARHLMQAKPSSLLGKASFDALQEILPMEDRAGWVDSASLESTLVQLHIRYKGSSSTVISELILGTGGPYSIKSLGKIQAKRVKSSDMVQLSYQYSDPGVSTQTLTVLLDVFTKRYKDLKESETGNVVAYFEQQLAALKIKLTLAEDKLTTFRSENRVINYGEQTKAIAIKKQNALEDFALKKMNLQAIQAALLNIEEKLKIRENVLSKNAQLLQKKQELTSLTSQIAFSEASENQEEVESMLTRQSKLKEGINNDLHELFNFSNTKEGLPNQQLLNDWLNNLIAFKKEEVNVKLYKTRLAELNAEYDRFAPLGSTLDRFEREIDVFEREYLEILHGLNLAKLKQQNIQLTSTLKIIDTPIYPNDPLASKRLLMVVAGFLVGLLGAVTVILIFEFLDNSLREPVKAQEDTQLPVIGAFPSLNPKSALHDSVDQLLQLTMDKIDLLTEEESGSTRIIAFSSVSPQTGKTYLTTKLMKALVDQGIQCLLVTEGEVESADSHLTIRSITKNQFNAADSIEKLLPDEELAQYAYIFVEIPALIKGKVPYTLLRSVHLNLLVERADRAWTQAHTRVLNNYQQGVEMENVSLFLNGMKPRFMENILGEVPVKVNFIKRLFKQVLRFELSKNNLPVL